LLPDIKEKKLQENKLNFNDFLKNRQFFATIVALAATLTGNLFTETGLLLGISEYPGYSV
jgi:hypothetical protein